MSFDSLASGYHPNMRNTLASALASIAIAAISLCVSPRQPVQDPTPGTQVEQSLTTSSGNDVDYLLYLPKNYTASGKKWNIPLLNGIIHFKTDFPFIFKVDSIPNPFIFHFP